MNIFPSSMANASVIPGDLQRENTEDVLQGERLSEADNCVPIPMQPAQGADVWEDMEHSRDRNLNHVQPLIRKVLFITLLLTFLQTCHFSAK